MTTFRSILMLFDHFYDLFDHFLGHIEGAVHFRWPRMQESVQKWLKMALSGHHSWTCSGRFLEIQAARKGFLRQFCQGMHELHPPEYHILAPSEPRAMAKYNGSGQNHGLECAQTGMIMGSWDAGQVVARVLKWWLAGSRGGYAQIARIVMAFWQNGHNS